MYSRLHAVLAWVCAAIALVAAGCSSSSDEPLVVTATFSTPEARNQFTEGNNHFAFDLYARLREKEGNLVVSPVSVVTALGMVVAGARGTTAEEIAAALHVSDLSREDAHKAAADLQNDLNGRGKERPFTLSIANRLWAHQDQAILDDFSALVKKQYGADIGRVDFIGAPDAAVKQISAWAAHATRDKIPAAIDRQHVDSLTRLVLVNAVYFLGKWDQPFDGEDTRLLDFFRTPDDQIRVPTMRQQDTFRFAHADGVKVLHMPYRGGKVSIILILPDAKDGLPDVESRLTTDSLRTWEQIAKNTEVRVWLPKFKLAGDLQLRAALAELGMSSAFEASRADFSGIAGKEANEKQPLFLQHVIHRAVVEVDEEGTEAAATTTVTTTTTSKAPGEPPPPPPEFRADHPFMFLLVEQETGAILFMGRVADPSKG